MINILSTASHKYTHLSVKRALPKVRLLSYELALQSRTLPSGAYIFTDLDRLGFWELEVASELYLKLRNSGCRVLNNPARALQRSALLVRLKSLGVNSFGIWRAEDGVIPDRYPVFLRTNAAHRGVLSDLIHNADDAQSELERLIDEGYPVKDLIFVEYCAEPLANGTFIKHSVYRVGERLIPSTSVLDVDWVAKHGRNGLATEDILLRENEIIRRNQYAGEVGSVFQAANIEYGRADFSIVKGKIEIYEINTNPMINIGTDHWSPIRRESLRIVREKYLEAIKDIRSDISDNRIIIDGPRLYGYRRAVLTGKLYKTP